MKDNGCEEQLGLLSWGYLGCGGGGWPNMRVTVRNQEVLNTPACTASSTNLQGTLDVYDDWGTGYCARIQLKNTGATPTTSWSVAVDTGNGTVTQSWNPINMTGSGNHTFSSASWNASIAPNATYNQSGFCATRTPGSSTRPAIGAITVNY